MPKHLTYDSLNEDELLLRYRSEGDNVWLGILLQRYTLLLLGVAMKYLKDKDAAQDAVQQIFLKALTSLPQEPILNFKGWLYVLMRNYCLQILRDKTYHADTETLEYMPAPEPELDELVLQDARLEHMNEAIGELQADQQDCVRRFYLEKQSYQQIMEGTGFTFAQVKSHIQNGKRNLKIALQKKLANYNRR